MACPKCGRPDVVVGLNAVLLEVWPEVRRHTCPGSTVGTECRNERCYYVYRNHRGTCVTA